MSANPKSTRQAGGHLFRTAAAQLGDATQWYRIAAINPSLLNADGLVDPWLDGSASLTIPGADPSGGNGGILGAP